MCNIPGSELQIGRHEYNYSDLGYYRLYIFQQLNDIEKRTAEGKNEKECEKSLWEGTRRGKHEEGDEAKRTEISHYEEENEAKKRTRTRRSGGRE